MPPTLQQIKIFPIKSLDGVAVEEIEVLASGALAHDRRFALMDQQGKVINGKRTSVVHSIRAEFDLPSMTVHLRADLDSPVASFSMLHERVELEAWFCDVLGMFCTLVEDTTTGLPDDTEDPGPTLISTATLREITKWFPGLTLEEARLRFRTNLEIEGVEPFWEDRLVGTVGEGIPFSIGEIDWLGMKACRRCVVPSRDSFCGEPTPDFHKRFTTKRERTLPAWSVRERFDHFYRLAVNTRLAPDSLVGSLSLGDTIRLG